jgi:flagellar hook-length control protein FliK
MINNIMDSGNQIISRGGTESSIGCDVNGTQGQSNDFLKEMISMLFLGKGTIPGKGIIETKGTMPDQDHDQAEKDPKEDVQGKSSEIAVASLAGAMMASLPKETLVTVGSGTSADGLQDSAPRPFFTAEGSIKDETSEAESITKTENQEELPKVLLGGDDNGFKEMIDPKENSGFAASEETSGLRTSQHQPKGGETSWQKKDTLPIVDQIPKEAKVNELEGLSPEIQGTAPSNITEAAKSIGQEVKGKNEKAKIQTGPEVFKSSYLIRGIAGGDDSEKGQDNLKGLENSKKEWVMDDRPETTWSEQQHDSKSNSERKNPVDQVPKSGELKMNTQGQSFFTNERPEELNNPDKNGATKITHANHPTEARETGLTAQQSFTIKNQGPSSVALFLEPAGLGKLDIELKVTHDRIHGQILVNDASGKDLIENNLPNLLSDMVNEGLQIGQFTVSLKNQGRDPNPNSFFQSQPGPRSGADEEGKIITPVTSENHLIHIII